MRPFSIQSCPVNKGRVKGGEGNRRILINVRPRSLTRSETRFPKKGLVSNELKVRTYNQIRGYSLNCSS